MKMKEISKTFRKNISKVAKMYCKISTILHYTNWKNQKYLHRSFLQVLLQHKQIKDNKFLLKPQ